MKKKTDYTTKGTPRMTPAERSEAAKAGWSSRRKAAGSAKRKGVVKTARKQSARKKEVLSPAERSAVATRAAAKRVANRATKLREEGKRLNFPATTPLATIRRALQVEAEVQAVRDAEQASAERKAKRAGRKVIAAKSAKVVKTRRKRAVTTLPFAMEPVEHQASV